MLEGPTRVRHTGDVRAGPRRETWTWDLPGQGTDAQPVSRGGGDRGASGRVVDTKHPQIRVEWALEESRWVWEDEGRGGLGISRRARW